jgi:hypothetical protein
VTDAGGGAFEILKNALRRMVQLTVCIGQRDGSCVAVEQFRADFAGWPMRRSLATAEKLFVSATRTNNSIALNRSTVELLAV